MSSELRLLGVAMLSLPVCWLWHAARERHWPGFASQRGSVAAATLAWLLFGGQGFVLALSAFNVALILTLPLAALALAGPIYVALYQAWPQATVRAAIAAAFIGALLIVLAAP